ncbi:hypothetical protein ACO2Q3_19845 [Caulobacter sp. KR2-114]|uniref:hypothetical protein n=1 Tax=Caulobacter sp. KR2-114 TaxID=3400912 RepID=UPI003C061C0B
MKAASYIAVAALTLTLVGCGKGVPAGQGTSYSSVSAGDRPSQAFLDERLIIPNAAGYLRPDITVGQVEASYARDDLHWRKQPEGYALDIAFKDDLTGKTGKMTLLFTPTHIPPEGTRQDAVEANEPFAQITRGVMGDDEEMDTGDVMKIATDVRNAHLPVPAALLARRQALVPTCDGPKAMAALAAVPSQFRDPFTVQHPTLTSLTAVQETGFDAMEGTRDCSATAHMDIGDRLIHWRFLVRSGQVQVQGGQVDNQPRPKTDASAATPARAGPVTTLTPAQRKAFDDTYFNCNQEGAPGCLEADCRTSPTTAQAKAEVQYLYVRTQQETPELLTPQLKACFIASGGRF